MDQKHNKIATLRRLNLQKLIDKKFDSKPARLSKSIGRTPTFYYDLLAGNKSFGEKLARQLESALDYEPYWLDTDHSDFSQGNKLIVTNRYIRKNVILCSDYCKRPSKIEFNATAYIVIDRDIEVSERCFLIEVNRDYFKNIPVGTMLLIDPDEVPEKNDVIILSYEHEAPTLVRYLPGFGGIQVEPLEKGYQGTVDLINEHHKTEGVVIWVQPKGYKI